MADSHESRNDEAALYLELKADSGFESEQRHRITLGQWGAISSILNGEEAPRSESGDIGERLRAKGYANVPLDKQPLALRQLLANAISAGGAYELKLYGTPGYVGTIAGITVHADPDVPEHTVIVKDEHGRELGRIINVGK